jgi:hypothetical protein
MHGLSLNLLTHAKRYFGHRVPRIKPSVFVSHEQFFLNWDHKVYRHTKLYLLLTYIFTIAIYRVWYTNLKHTSMYVFASILILYWYHSTIKNSNKFTSQFSFTSLPCFRYCRTQNVTSLFVTQYFHKILLLKLLYLLSSRVSWRLNYRGLLYRVFPSNHTNSETRECLMQLFTSSLHIFWAPLIQYDSARTPCFLKLHKSITKTLHV